jgi:hypothetical protein
MWSAVALWCSGGSALHFPGEIGFFGSRPSPEPPLSFMRHHSFAMLPSQMDIAAARRWRIDTNFPVAGEIVPVSTSPESPFQIRNASTVDRVSFVANHNAMGTRQDQVIVCARSCIPSAPARLRHLALEIA